jgi:serine/threonine protein kinase
MSSVASNAPCLAPGCRLDRYNLLLQVAEGGMGLLWLARQQGKHGFDKLVAIKTILPKLASDPGFRQMFLDEARVVSRIEHPNVAQVLDLGEEQGVLFLVMEWIDGESLIKVGHTALRETGAQIPVGILTRIMIDVCAGLHAAHQLTDDDGLSLGVVHRDVSPHNLLVGFRGTTKVIDFGIAKVRNRISQETSIGLLKGKIAYMAPEQAMGNGVDRRTDVWSAGATMYRFLAGRVPYSAPEPLAVLRRIAEGLPAPPLPDSVPEPIRLVVERALDPDTTRRFATAHAMGVALESAMRAAHAYTTRDDVAAFMEEHLGEERAMRGREIEHAVRESRAQVRVELANTESPLVTAIPISSHAPASGPSSAASWVVKPPGVEALPEGQSRPSRRPTALRDPDGPPRPSRQPTAIAPLRSSDDRAPEAPSRGAVESPRPSAWVRGKLAAIHPVTPAAGRPAALPRPSQPLARWLSGACLLVLLIAGGFALRTARPSRTAGAGDAPSSPGRLPVLAQATLAPLRDPVPADTAAPSASVPTFAHPRDERAPAPPLAETPVADRGPGDDPLERARAARRAGRIADAAALFAAAVEKAPADSEALTGLAEVDDAQGATGKAIALYRHALAVNPKYLPARLGLADSLWTSGQRGEARAAYRGIVDEVPATLIPDVARVRAGGASGREGP